MTPSKYQQKIYDFIQNGEGNGIVEAVAGSGKTTTIVNATKVIPVDKKVCFLAFNKSIAEELKTRLPAHCEASTLNSLGHRAWMRHMQSIKLDANKTSTIMFDALTDDEMRQFGTNIKKLVSLAKAHLVVPKSVYADQKIGIEDNEEVWLGFIDKYDIELNIRADVSDKEFQKQTSDCIKLAQRILELSCEIKNVIDFDDQIYLTTVFKARMGKYDFVFVDEAQDLNPAQMTMIQSLSGRIIALGDSRQCIYAFRGAGTDSMANFKEIFNATSLDLSICYRCPKSHILLAKTIVPQIEAPETAIEGEIQRLGQKWNSSIFSSTDLVICRINAPLVKLAYMLLGEKIPVRILGRDIGAGLISLIRKFKTNSLKELTYKLQKWSDRECDKMRRKDHDADCSKVEDKYETIMTFIEMFPNATPEGICKEIETMYSDNTKGILTLSTIHRVKGLEADKVFVLNGWLMPMKSARQPWQQQQEQNLQYVAYTRSKKSLVFIDITKDGKK